MLPRRTGKTGTHQAVHYPERGAAAHCPCRGCPGFRVQLLWFQPAGQAHGSIRDHHLPRVSAQAPDPQRPGDRLYLSMWLVINKKAWNKLSRDDQAIFTETARELEQWTRDYAKNETEEDMAFLKKEKFGVVLFGFRWGAYLFLMNYLPL